MVSPVPRTCLKQIHIFSSTSSTGSSSKPRMLRRYSMTQDEQRATRLTSSSRSPRRFRFYRAMSQRTLSIWRTTKSIRTSLTICTWASPPRRNKRRWKRRKTERRLGSRSRSEDERKRNDSWLNRSRPKELMSSPKVWSKNCKLTSNCKRSTRTLTANHPKDSMTLMIWWKF